MKKQALLFLVHNNNRFFEKLLLLLDSEYFDFYVHVDLKSDINIFNKIKSKLKFSQIYFVEDKNRIDVRWGDYSIVEAELELLRLAQKSEYEMYHLLSGADFILQTPKKIYDFFHEHNDREFIEFWTEKSESEKRYIERYKYFNNLYPAKKTFFSKLKYHTIRNLSVLLQKILFVDRLKNIEEKIKLGSQWFSISHEFSKYLVINEEKIYSIYNHTQVPDESFIQTMAFNSDYFRNRIFCMKFDDNYDNIKREIYFENGVPHVWNEKDWERLRDSSNFFARKFNEGYSDIVIRKLMEKIEREMNDGI